MDMTRIWVPAVAGTVSLAAVSIDGTEYVNESCHGHAADRFLAGGTDEPCGATIWGFCGSASTMPPSTTPIYCSVDRVPECLSENNGRC